MNSATIIDPRYQCLRNLYTTAEQFKSLSQDLLAAGIVNRAQISAVVDRLQDAECFIASCEKERTSNQCSDQEPDVSQWPIEAAFAQLALLDDDLASIMNDGYQAFWPQVNWGLTRIAHLAELDRDPYKKAQASITYAPETSGGAARAYAHRALQNGWWSEAVKNLQLAIEANPTDYLAHLHLGHVLWFYFGNWQSALEQFQLAAKYSDIKHARHEERFYAALAFSHCSLMWRLHATTYPQDKQNAIQSAHRCSTRAIQLRPDLTLARQEHAANCLETAAISPETMANSLNSELMQLLLEDAQSLERLNAYRCNPCLKSCGPLQSWVASSLEAARTRSKIAPPAEVAGTTNKNEGMHLVSATVRSETPEQEVVDDSAPKQQEPVANQRQHSLFVFGLCLVFLAVGLTFSLGHRILLVETAWSVLIIPFCFGMIGSLVLFHYLSSSAHIEREEYKVGGAIAGFITLFGLFYNIAKDPVVRESRLYRIAHSKSFNALIPIAESYDAVFSLNNSKLRGIADDTLETTKRTFADLSAGRYYVTADELPIHLLPMIQNARKTYYATQFVLPDTFWQQSWSKEYFRRNVEAVKRRRVKLTRIFLLDEKEAKEQKDILNNLIRMHIDNGIDIRIVDATRYGNEVNRQDLKDLLIVDNEITGMLLLDKGGRFSKVEFSVDPRAIRERQLMFEKLLQHSMQYAEWKQEYYDKWSQSE